MAISSEPQPSSRRALLAGILGGLGAWAAGAVGRANPARAADGDILHAGDELSASSVTSLTTTNSHALAGVSTNQTGMRGISSTYLGMEAGSSSFWGIWAHSSSSIGLVGSSGALSQPNPSFTGVYGAAQQDASSKGVWGVSPAGHGIHGESEAGWAGYFDGKVFTNRFIEFAEIANPGAPGANRAKIFARDNGSGHTQLCVRFHNGVVRVLATA